MRNKWVLFLAMAAAAVMMVACGRNRNDADTNSVTHTEESDMAETGDRRDETEGSDENGIIDHAETLISDVIDEGKDIVSDIVDDGREIVTEMTDHTSDSTETVKSRLN